MVIFDSAKKATYGVDDREHTAQAQIAVLSARKENCQLMFSFATRTSKETENAERRPAYA
jgi:hypothetical protein